MKRYLDALFKLMLFSASIHMIILIGLAIYRADIVVLNYFNILDLDLFFPGIILGIWSQVISLITVILIYIICLKFFTKNS